MGWKMGGVGGHYFGYAGVKGSGIAFIRKPNETAAVDYQCDGQRGLWGTRSSHCLCPYKTRALPTYTRYTLWTAETNTELKWWSEPSCRKCYQALRMFWVSAIKMFILCVKLLCSSANVHLYITVERNGCF